MKTLNLHCDYIRFSALKKALKNVDELAPNQTLEGESSDCLVVLVAVEKGDTIDSAQTLSHDVKGIAKQLNVNNIVLYPYAHLSSNLGNPSLAVGILNESAKRLDDFNVVKAPFGFYKSFELKVKGHPLSELSREFKVEGNEESLELDKKERELLWKKMSKIKMQAPKGLSGKKSNVELGRELDLYIVSEVVGQGLPLLTPKGATIKREIERFIVDEELRRGYVHTSTPVMAKSDLFKLSGHWQHYKDDMFVLGVQGSDFALRPMTCPFHFVLYKRKPRSYKDLPKRYAEVASLFRNEKSGELRGLTRVRQFTLADAHIICSEDQLESEFRNVLDLVQYIMDLFGIDVWYRFSRHDPDNKEKYVNNPKAWKNSEESMRNILINSKVDFKEAKGEAAFYGPKLDLQYKDVYGKEDTLITIQLDFSSAEKFNLTYLDSKGKEKRPMIIHRSSTGATERVISYLLEKFQGSLPLWLSPVQVKVLNMNENSENYALSIQKELAQNGIRAEVDVSNESIGKKVRNAIVEKSFYLVTVGDKEMSEKTVSVRRRDSKDLREMKIADFIDLLKEEISSKQL